MGNYGKPKKIVGRNFRANLLLYSCIILGCYALFNVNKFFIKDFERGYSATGMGYVAFIVIAIYYLKLFLNFISMMKVLHVEKMEPLFIMKKWIISLYLVL